MKDQETALMIGTTTRGSDIAGTFAERNLLVTGVTGFLGKVWLAMLLHRIRNMGHVFVLARGRRNESPRRRFERIVEFSPAFRPLRTELGTSVHSFLRERLTIVEGDVAEPLCGIETDVLERVAPQLDLIVHFAGITDFEPDPVLALRTNVHGAIHVADVAARSRGKRVLHVSTTFVAGTVSGTIPENLTRRTSPLGKSFEAASEAAQLARICATLDTKQARIDAANQRAHALGWPNLYTYTKGLAEHLLAERQDVQTTIARPAVVECAREYPIPGWNEGINTSGPLVALFASSFRRFPSRPNHRFDVIPVDTVARALVVIASAALRDDAARVYQLGSSDTRPLTFERAIELTNLAVRRMLGRKDARAVDRFLVRYLDCVPVQADAPQVMNIATMRRTAQRARELIRGVDLERNLPPSLYERFGGALEERLRSLSMSFRNADRRMARVEEMLRLYRPFIHDNDYVFTTQHIRDASAALSEHDRALFGFDIDTLNWRSYWLDVHVPGLEKWCLPLLRGERPPEDEAESKPALIAVAKRQKAEAPAFESRVGA